MSGEPERRGWDIENDYHQHFLDDADFVIDGEEEEVRWFWAIAALAILLCIGVWLLGKWLEPPPVVFSPPLVPLVTPKSSAYSCAWGATGTTTAACTLSSGMTTGTCIGN